jgi:hypothetical protein
MTFLVSAQNGSELVKAECPREEAALGVALDYIDRGFSAVQAEDAQTGAVYGAQFLVAYALSRVQAEITPIANSGSCLTGS